MARAAAGSEVRRNVFKLVVSSSRSAPLARRQIGFQQDDAFQQIGGHVLGGVYFFGEIDEPGREQVGPGFDREHVAGVVGGHEFAAPAVVVKRGHGRLIEGLGVFTAPFDCGTQQLMAVAEDIGLHHAGLAGNAFGWIAAAVD